MTLLYTYTLNISSFTR